MRTHKVCTEELSNCEGTYWLEINDRRCRSVNNRLPKAYHGHSRPRSGSSMEEKAGSPPAVRAEEQSQSILFTYFQGDINSVVDEHFSRALNKANKPKDLSTKNKSRRSPKIEALAPALAPAPGPVPGPAPAPWVFPASGWSEADFSPGSSGRIQLPAADDLHSPPGVITSPNGQPSALWPFSPRTSAGFGISGMVYSPPVSTEGPNSSFLNLLHSDRPVGGPAMGSASKPELTQAWSPSPGFREPHGSGISLDGIQGPEKKKDLYWY